MFSLWHFEADEMKPNLYASSKIKIIPPPMCLTADPPPPSEPSVKQF